MPTSSDDRLLRVFLPARSYKLKALYFIVALVGFGLLAAGLRMLYECYLWLAGERLQTPSWFMMVVIPAFLAMGTLASTVGLNVIFRSDSIYTEVRTNRLRYADGFIVREVPWSDVAAAIYEAEHDTAARVSLYLKSGKRRDLFAAVLLSEPERNELISLINQLAADRRS